jgi:hypothetical protein
LGIQAKTVLSEPIVFNPFGVRFGVRAKRLQKIKDTIVNMKDNQAKRCSVSWICSDALHSTEVRPAFFIHQQSLAVARTQGEATEQKHYPWRRRKLARHTHIAARTRCNWTPMTVAEPQENRQ